jgi:hypothetical protein
MKAELALLIRLLSPTLRGSSRDLETTVSAE